MAGEIAAAMDDGGLRRALNEAPGRLFRALKRRVHGYLFRWVRHFSASAFAGPLNVRTGTMRRAFTSVAVGSTASSLRFITGTMKNDVPYAAIHEHGGTIRPTKAKFLTIPLEAAKTAAGVARGGARFFENTFFMRSKAGNLFLMQRDGNEVRPLFLLKKEVYIPPRLGFYRAFDRQMPELIRHFNAAIEEALEGPTAA